MKSKFKSLFLLGFLLLSTAMAEADKSSSMLITSNNSQVFNGLLFFTADLKFSENFLTKNEMPKIKIRNQFKTNETFEIVTIFRKYLLIGGEAKIQYGLKIIDPNGKSYFQKDDFKIEQKKLSTNEFLLIDPKQFVRIKFEPKEAKGKYKVILAGLDQNSRQYFTYEAIFEHY